MRRVLYRPRDAEHTVLHQVVCEHLEALLRNVGDATPSIRTLLNDRATLVPETRAGWTSSKRPSNKPLEAKHAEFFGGGGRQVPQNIGTVLVFMAELRLRMARDPGALEYF